jgi:hypothetical protein
MNINIFNSKKVEIAEQFLMFFPFAKKRGVGRV